MKKTTRREPLQLVFWTAHALHLGQRGCQAAADAQDQRALRLRTELQPQRDPSWAARAYDAFWEGKEEV